jgi:hypothetical protein
MAEGKRSKYFLLDKVTGLLNVWIPCYGKGKVFVLNNTMMKTSLYFEIL